MPVPGHHTRPPHPGAARAIPLLARRVGRQRVVGLGAARRTAVAAALGATLLGSVAISSTAASGFGVHEVAVRVGFRFDPDQVLLGSHLHLYEPGDQWRFGLAGALGFGDDVTAIDLSPEVHYVASDSPLAPDTYFYAGGGIDWANFWTSVGEFDTEHSSDSGLTLLGGIERHLDSGSTFFGEFRVRFGDTEWFALVFGLGFPRR